MANPVNAFGQRLLSTWRANNPTDNIIFSPLSLASAFLLVYKGARGRTKDELCAVFGFSEPGAVDKLVAQLESLSGDSIATLANRLYIQQSLTLENAYVQSVGEENVEQTDFEKASEQATTRINDWVAAKTHGLIPEIISTDALDSSTALVIVNALYFRGKWYMPFPKGDTRDDVFYGVNGSQRVPFMTHHKKKFLYKKVPALDGVSIALPYRDSQFAMCIFLPNRRNGWKKAEKKLPKHFDAAFGTLDFHNEEIAELKMPKWTLECTLDNVEELLKKIGLKTAFTRSADFSGITRTAPIDISNVFHKAKIVVDEVGTEAAASTGVTMVLRCLRMAPPISVIIDHPFLYCIMDAIEGTILFQGTQTSFAT